MARDSPRRRRTGPRGSWTRQLHGIPIVNQTAPDEQAPGPAPGPAASSAAAKSADGAPAPVLEIEDLQTHFFTGDGVVRAVDGVSYSVRSGETLGVVGESGCGKSVTALSVLRLVADPPGRIVGGAIRSH